MRLAEELYQGGYISYPRTETDQFDRQYNLQVRVGWVGGVSGWVGGWCEWAGGWCEWVGGWVA